MKKVTFFDVEFANSRNKSICQIGLICRDFDSGEELLPPVNCYVNPEDGFDEFCIRIHEISPKTVENEPNFPTLWERLKPYFTDTIVIGHNVAGADLNALEKTLIRYELEVPSLNYICTLDLAKQVVAKSDIENYHLDTLCNYFGIIFERAHSAFDDASACMKLFEALMSRYDINLDDVTSLYCAACASKKRTYENTFSTYVCDRVVRQKVADFYGIIKGINIDKEITRGEEEALRQWRNENQRYSDNNEITAIIAELDCILVKKKVSKSSVKCIEKAVEPFLSVATTACETLAIQILNGILKGIIADGEVFQKECQNLYKWICEHDAFLETYPFNETLKLLKPVVKKENYSDEDSALLIEKIAEILNPVQTQATHTQATKDLTGKTVCLSGNFAYGKKADVAKFIQERGGIVSDSINRNTDILVMGANESLAYAHGKYGTKVLKAMRNNQNGANTQIMKECDFFETYS